MGAPDIEMGLSRFGTPASSDSSLESPREPNTSTWRGRLLSSTCPGISTIIGISEIAFALYAFLGPDSNNIVGGIHATLSVFALCNSGAFWKYYFQANWGEQANSVQEQLEAERKAEQEKRENAVKYDGAIDRLGKAGEKFEQIDAAEARQQEVDAPKEAELIQKLIDLFSQPNLPGNLPEQLQPFIEKLAQILATLKNAENDQGRNLNIMKTVNDALGQFQEKLGQQVQQLKLERDNLRAEVVQLKVSISGFKDQIQELTTEFATIKEEYDHLKEEMQKLEDARKGIGENVRHNDGVVVRLREILERYEKVVPLLKELKDVRVPELPAPVLPGTPPLPRRSHAKPALPPERVS